MSNPVLRPKSVSKSGGEGFLKGCSEVDGSCENPRAAALEKCFVLVQKNRGSRGRKSADGSKEFRLSRRSKKNIPSWKGPVKITEPSFPLCYKNDCHGHV